VRITGRFGSKNLLEHMNYFAAAYRVSLLQLPTIAMISYEMASLLE